MRSGIMPGLPTYLVQELNVGTVGQTLKAKYIAYGNEKKDLHVKKTIIDIN